MPGRDRVHEQNNATAPSLAKTARRLSLWTRRDALTAFAAVASQTLWPYHLLAQQAEGDATLPRHRQLKVEVTGTLELDPTGQKATTSPFSVNASFDFVERSARDGRIYWTARTFEEATRGIDQANHEVLLLGRVPLAERDLESGMRLLRADVHALETELAQIALHGVREAPRWGHGPRLAAQGLEHGPARLVRSRST